MMPEETTPKNQREFIDYRFNELDKKVTDIQLTLRTFTFVKQSDFDDFKRDVKENYATKAYVGPAVKAIYSLIGLILVLVIGAVIGARLK